MKYFGTIILTLVVAVGMIVGVYYYFNGYNEPKSSVTLTTAATKETTENSNKVFLAENKDGDFKLYKQGKKVLLEHNGKTNEFTGWSEYIDAEKPKMYYADFDNDGERELLIQVVSGNNLYGGETKYSYDLYILSPQQQENGDYEYTIVQANRDTWRQPFEQYIKCGVNQLKKDKSRIQVVMDNASNTISYNEDTGISTSKYVGYARADKNNEGNYKTLARWDKGNGKYVIDGNKITVEIDIRVTYEDEKTASVIGKIYCGLVLESSEFSIRANSVYFEASEDRRVTDPRETASENWKYTIDNIATAASSTDTNINWIEAEFEVPSSGSSDEKSFVSMESEIKSVDSIEITNRKIVLTAKDGFNFVNSNVTSGDYSVSVTLDDVDYDIVSSAEVSTSGSNSVLTFTLDKSYKRSHLKNISIKFGA